MNDERRYQEPNWWRSLTPRGKTVFTIFCLAVFVLLMITVGTIETWGL